MKKWMKQVLKTTIAATVTALMLSSTVFADGWGQQQETGRWRYDVGGQYYVAAQAGMPRWEWLDGNGDGIGERYAFDTEGWMYANTRTPDGYDVNENGAWTLNGVVQTANVAPGYKGTLGEAANQTPAPAQEKVLIAYFSHTGTTQEAARRIQEVTGGDLFEIRTVNDYPNTYQATVDVARTELDNNARPALSTQVENMADYTTILLGYPIRWHTTPMAVNTFLESYDLSGKTILPFCTSGGSSIEESMPAVRASAGNGLVGAGLTANSLTRERIQNWFASREER